MKKIILTAVLLVITVSLFAQTSNLKKVLVIQTSPSFTLQLNLNYNEGMGQLGGTYNADFQSSEFINGRNFGAGKGYGADAIAKVKLDDMGHFRVLFSAFFNTMGSYLFGNTKTTIYDQGGSRFNIFSIGAGIENNFTPNHKMKIYVGLQPLFSIISGKATLYAFDPWHLPYNQHVDSIYSVKIKPAFRIGAVLTGGIEYLLNESIGVNFGFNFIDANLLLKSANDSGDPYNINLIDNESSTLTMYSGKKNMVIMNITAGISFYWGVGAKRYILSQ